MWTVKLIQAIVLLYTRVLVMQNLMHRWHQVYQVPTQKHAEKAGGHLPSGLWFWFYASSGMGLPRRRYMVFFTARMIFS